MAGGPYELGAGATAVHWVGNTAFFALADGAVCAISAAGADRHALHDGAILCACPHPDGGRLVTGGDDGKLHAISTTGQHELLLDTRGKWIDHVVASGNVIVASSGKHAIVLQDGQELHRFEHPSSVGGLALDAKGRRLAASHYGGVTVRYVLTKEDKGSLLKWSGSHLTTTMSPDGDYVITAMQENALHGWRLPEKIDLRMDGYPSKTRSFSWDKRGRWLATSGADSAIVWPFVGKLGPQGKTPLQLGARDALVTAVAFQPNEETLAIGYSDGAAALVRFAVQIPVELAPPGDGPVACLAWRADGGAVAVGDEAGRATIWNAH